MDRFINAIKKNDLTEIKNILCYERDVKDNKGNTYAHYACQQKMNKVLALIIETKVDTDVLNYSDETPLISVFKYLQGFYFKKDRKARRRLYKTVQLLLSNRPSNINQVSVNGETALHLAVRGAERNAVPTKCIKLLLKRGANPNLLNNNGQTCYEVAYNRHLGKIGDLLFGYSYNDFDKEMKEKGKYISQISLREETYFCNNNKKENALQSGKLKESQFLSVYDVIESNETEERNEKKDLHFTDSKREVFYPFNPYFRETETETQLPKLNGLHPFSPYVTEEKHHLEYESCLHGIKQHGIDYDCPICRNMYSVGARIFQCCEGHVFCESCRNKMDSCPECRTNISFDIRNRALEKVIHSLAATRGRVQE